MITRRILANPVAPTILKTLIHNHIMTLYTLLGGRSKKKMKRLETNSKQKCENYMKQLQKTKNSVLLFFEIREALPEEELKVHKSQNKWTRYDYGGPVITRQKGVNGPK